MTDPVPPPPAGVLSDTVHSLPIRVYYEDTDFSGVVYHASYLRFLERGRTEFLRALGVDQRALHAADGIGFAVRRLTIDYLRPARMDDVLTVDTTAGVVRGASMTLSQAIRRDAELLITAEVLVACVAAGRPARLPVALKAVAAHSVAGREDRIPPAE